MFVTIPSPELDKVLPAAPEEEPPLAINGELTDTNDEEPVGAGGVLTTAVEEVACDRRDDLAVAVLDEEITDDPKDELGAVANAESGGSDAKPTSVVDNEFGVGSEDAPRFVFFPVVRETVMDVLPLEPK